MKTTYIYTLTDPTNNMIRYVGKTNNPKQRYSAHLNGARKHQAHKKNWIEKLKKEGLKPIFEIVDEVLIEDWVFWEKWWISLIKSWGYSLVNYTSGGDGCSFANQTSFKKGNNSKEIVALNRNGLFEKEFKTIYEAEIFCGKKCVDHALLKNIKSAGGFLWLYKKAYDEMSQEELSDFVNWCNTKNKSINSGCFKQGCVSLNKGRKGYETKKRKPVDQFDLNGVHIKEFGCCNDAAKELKCCPESIRTVCVGKKNNFKGYIFKYKK